MAGYKNIGKNPNNRLGDLMKRLRSAPGSILVVDPGNVDSGYCGIENGIPQMRGLQANKSVLKIVRDSQYDHLVIEMPGDMGYSFDSLFETAYFAGQCVEASAMEHTRIYRYEVLSHLKAGNDGEVRAAMLKRFGKEATKEFKYDAWQALGTGVTFLDYCAILFRSS